MTETHCIVPAIGWFQGLPAHIRSIRAYSPGTKIHLLHNGHSVQRLEAAGVMVDSATDINHFRATYIKFLAACVYKPLADNMFQAACYQRHHAAYDYARAVGLKSFWYFDWDVLVMFDLAEEAERLKNWKGIRHSGNFWVNDLDYFGAYLESWNRHPLVAQATQINPEMNVERDLFNTTDVRNSYWDSVCLNQNSKYYDGSIYDENLACANWFLHNEAHAIQYSSKWIVFKRNGSLNYPHGWNTLVNDWVRLKTLHCWGVHKQRMDQYLKIGTA